MMIFKERWHLLIFIPSILLILAIGLAKVLFQVPIYKLIGDVFSIADIHPLSGLLSNIGVLLWCAAATICFFVAGVLRQTKNYRVIPFLLASACLSMYLLIDDFFLLHEELVPTYIGILQNTVLMLIMIAVVVYLFWFRRIILRTQYGFMLIAIGFLGISVGVDTVLKPWLLFLGEWKSLLEDGAKLIGITSWLSYYTDVAYQFLLDKSRII
ncbi:hypothetical protein N836_21900 [Leptolyngbya sp. Heron Island J]|uniref:hypothetical protein n=1 Tax=Leptolyngbya sp. Heron Island J TaxID=1385935 RepID=UPI0003B96EF1|nr:hypothetical protein [Leptolyngbya sp. Heron Island J]ESA33343.1 hypothetical protein N836_21900 [Leptolyngbya sp. Heron Island J]